jgi:predicted enzyme related to lactoylglutathione lyase
MSSLAAMSHGEAVLYVQHLEAMADFYERALALERADQAKGFCELRTAAGWTLWLVPGKGTASYDGTGAVRRRSEVPIKLCFVVAGIAAARAAIDELGGRISEGDWVFGGYRRADAIDPEGNVVQLLEACSADAPGA